MTPQHPLAAGLIVDQPLPRSPRATWRHWRPDSHRDGVREVIRRAIPRRDHPGPDPGPATPKHVRIIPVHVIDG